MIARSYRFHGHNALTYAYRRGRVSRAPGVLIRIAANPRRERCRVAVVVSKKVLKSAVLRNRVRRRLLTQLAPRVGELGNVDIIITVTDAMLPNTPQKTINKIIFNILQITASAGVPVDK